MFFRAVMSRCRLNREEHVNQGEDPTPKLVYLSEEESAVCPPCVFEESLDRILVFCGIRFGFVSAFVCGERRVEVQGAGSMKANGIYCRVESPISLKDFEPKT